MGLCLNPDESQKQESTETEEERKPTVITKVPPDHMESTITYGTYDHPSVLSRTKQSPETHFEARMLNPTFNPNCHHKKLSTGLDSPTPQSIKPPDDDDDPNSMLVSPTILNDNLSSVTYSTYTLSSGQLNDIYHINPVRFKHTTESFEYAGNMAPPTVPPDGIFSAIGNI